MAARHGLAALTTCHDQQPLGWQEGGNGPLQTRWRDRWDVRPGPGAVPCAANQRPPQDAGLRVCLAPRAGNGAYPRAASARATLGATGHRPTGPRTNGGGRAAWPGGRVLRRRLSADTEAPKVVPSATECSILCSPAWGRRRTRRKDCPPLNLQGSHPPGLEPAALTCTDGAFWERT